MGDTKRLFVPISFGEPPVATHGPEPTASETALPNDVIEAGVQCLTAMDLDQLFFRPDPRLYRDVVSAIYLSMEKQLRLSRDIGRSPSS